MRHGAEAAQVEYHQYSLSREVMLAHVLQQDVEPLLALAAADDLADARHQEIHRADRPAVVIHAACRTASRFADNRTA